MGKEEGTYVQTFKCLSDGSCRLVGLQTGLLPVWLVFHVATSFRLDIPRAAYLGIFGGYVAQERTRHELLASNVGRKTQNKV